MHALNNSTKTEHDEKKELSNGYNIHMSPLSISITIQVRMEDDKITTFNGHVLCYDYDCLCLQVCLWVSQEIYTHRT
jgi:hypothetical protein